MRIWSELTGRLFKLVFGWYLLLALTVTTVQLGIEFSATSRSIRGDLESFGKSFAPSVADNLWTFDRPQLETVANGLKSTAAITGVKIESRGGQVVVAAGVVPNPETQVDGGLLAPFQVQRFPLEIKSPRGGQKTIGQLVLFSDRSVVLDRIKYSFMIILVNSLIKSAGLWFIFYLVISRVLARPLLQATAVISSMEFTADSKELFVVEQAEDDELGRLLAEMAKLKTRLSTARAELDEINSNLEKTVAERTNSLMEMVNFNKSIMLYSPIPKAVFDGGGRCVSANEAFASLTGAAVEQLQARNLKEIPTWQDSGLFEACQVAVAERKVQQREVHFQTPSGREAWLDCRIVPTTLSGHEHLLVQCVDQSERKLHEKELQQMAYFDALTQLPNRRMLLERFRQAQRTSKRNRHYLAVLLLDLNKFKQLNDAHGHDAGDQLLVEVSSRLLRAVRDSDTVARIGGDEFVVLLENLGLELEQAEACAQAVAHKIRQKLDAEFMLGNIRHVGSASIGVSIALGAEADLEAMLKMADTQMYLNKRGGQTGVPSQF